MIFHWNKIHFLFPLDRPTLNYCLFKTKDSFRLHQVIHYHTGSSHPHNLIYFESLIQIKNNAYLTLNNSRFPMNFLVISPKCFDLFVGDLVTREHALIRSNTISTLVRLCVSSYKWIPVSPTYWIIFAGITYRLAPCLVVTCMCVVLRMRAACLRHNDNIYGDTNQLCALIHAPGLISNVVMRGSCGAIFISAIVVFNRQINHEVSSISFVSVI